MLGTKLVIPPKCTLSHALKARPEILQNGQRIIAERQSVRQINDALGRFYSTLVYVRIFVCNADRHSHTVTLGKDRHIHMRIYACAHGHTALRWRLKRLLWRDGEGWQERGCYCIFQLLEMGGVISLYKLTTTLQPKVLGFVWCTLSHRLFPKAMDNQPEKYSTEYFRLVGFCCSLYKQPLMNTIVVINNKMGVTVLM